MAVHSITTGCSAGAMALLYRSPDPSRAYYGTDARVGALLTGALLAVVLARADARGGLRLTPRGASPVAVYGRAYPEPAAFPPEVPTQTVAPLGATIQPGQAYVAAAPVSSDYYQFKTVDGSRPGDGTLVRGQTLYYPIELDHRRAFVKVDDVRPTGPAHGGD